MNGNKIISILSDNMTSIASPVKTIVGAIITAIFLRNNTSVSEFEKIKAGIFREVTDNLLKSGVMTYTERV